MKKIFYFFFLFISPNLYSEKISISGVDVRNIENTRTLYRLEPSTDIDFIYITNSVARIRALVWVDTLKINREGDISENTILYDSLGKRIGNIYEKFHLERYYTRSGDRIRCELFGNISMYTIDKNSILENDLQLILSKKKQILFDDFEKHFLKYDYINWEGTGEFTSKYFPEAAVNTLKPGGRIVLIFLHDELAGIVYSRDLKVSYYESKAESTPYKIFYMKKMSDAEKKKLAEFYFEKVRSN